MVYRYERAQFHQNWTDTRTDRRTDAGQGAKHSLGHAFPPGRDNKEMLLSYRACLKEAKEG